MDTPLLATKLHIPPARSNLVPRPRLLQRLDVGLQPGHRLILVSAPAGFGKTTLLSAWIAGCAPRTRFAWLSLDQGDNDPTRFLIYLVVALQTIESDLGQGVLAALQSPGAVNVEAVLTTLLNDIVNLSDNLAARAGQRLVLVLDDYHVIESQAIDQALTFLLRHMPPQRGMHLVIATREDPRLPLARLRVRGQLTELRVTDLRFAPAEAAEFLNQVMGLDLSEQDVAALKARTEGWIAGLQLAALALQGTVSRQGYQDATRFINSFTGSHHFVMDYLLKEVLHQQPESVQTFLLRTSILDRLCGPLCDAVCSVGTDVTHEGADRHPILSASGQETLEYLEQANLFIVPLDDERRWYRYHHLFADLLRQRLQQNPPPLSSPLGGIEGFQG